MEPDVRTDNNTTDNLSDSDLRRMMRDPKYWRDAEPEYVRKIENGFKKIVFIEKNCTFSFTMFLVFDKI